MPDCLADIAAAITSSGAGGGTRLDFGIASAAGSGTVTVDGLTMPVLDTAAATGDVVWYLDNGDLRVALGAQA